jgi:di/tricarboxylate transporter
MRRRFVHCFAVVILVLSMVAPASASPRRDDDSQLSFIGRIVQIIKHIVKPLEEIKPQLPTP